MVIRRAWGWFRRFFRLDPRLALVTKRAEEFREVIEGVVPGLPKPHVAAESGLPACGVQKLAGTLRDPVLRIAEEQRAYQPRIRLVFLGEGSNGVAEQVLELGNPARPSIRWPSGIHRAGAAI